MRVLEDARIIAILSIVFLGEKITLQTIAGMLFAFVAIVLLSLK